MLKIKKKKEQLRVIPPQSCQEMAMGVAISTANRRKFFFFLSASLSFSVSHFSLKHVGGINNSIMHGEKCAFFHSFDVCHFNHKPHTFSTLQGLIKGLRFYSLPLKLSV